MKGQQGCPGQGVLWFLNPTCKCAKTLILHDAVDQKYQHSITTAFVGATVLQMRTGQGKRTWYPSLHFQYSAWLDLLFWRRCCSVVRTGARPARGRSFPFPFFYPSGPSGWNSRARGSERSRSFSLCTICEGRETGAGGTGKFNWKQYWHPQLRHVPTVLQDLESLIAQPCRQNSLPHFCF